MEVLVGYLLAWCNQQPASMTHARTDGAAAGPTCMRSRSRSSAMLSPPTSSFTPFFLLLSSCTRKGTGIDEEGAELTACRPGQRCEVRIA